MARAGTAAIAFAAALLAGVAARAIEAPIPVPPPIAADEEEQAREAVAGVIAFMLGRPSRIAPADAAEADQEALDAALADLDVARVIAEVHELADVRLALAVFDAAAAHAPLSRARVFAPAATLGAINRILPALNAAIDRVERAVPGFRNAAIVREFARSERARRERALPLPVLSAAAVSLAVAAGPFALLEALERCGRPGEGVPPRSLVAALSLAAPDLYDFYRRSFADPDIPADAGAREAFIRNLRGAAQRCAS